MDCIIFIINAYIYFYCREIGSSKNSNIYPTISTYCILSNITWSYSMGYYLYFQ